MNTFDLVEPNDDVQEGSSSFDLEDSIGVSSLSLSSAADTAIKHLHATIEGLSSRMVCTALSTEVPEDFGRVLARAASLTSEAWVTVGLGAAVALRMRVATAKVRVSYCILSLREVMRTKVDNSKN
jgi:hypothetical protein